MFILSLLAATHWDRSVTLFTNASHNDRVYTFPANEIFSAWELPQDFPSQPVLQTAVRTIFLKWHLWYHLLDQNPSVACVFYKRSSNLTGLASLGWGFFQFSNKDLTIPAFFLPRTWTYYSNPGSPFPSLGRWETWTAPHSFKLVCCFASILLRIWILLPGSLCTPLLFRYVSRCVLFLLTLQN